MQAMPIAAGPFARAYQNRPESPLAQVPGLELWGNESNLAK